MRVQKHFIPNFEMRSVLLLALLTMGTAATVRSQAAAGTIPPNQVTSQDLAAAFQRADANGDGKLSRQEAERFPAVAQRFEQIDANRDTFISLDEFSQAANS